MVVAAVDFRQSPDYPYPAQVVDVNLAIRWLKTHAADFNADPLTVGGIAGSSGGHTIMLSAMCPFDAYKLVGRHSLYASTSLKARGRSRRCSMSTVARGMRATACKASQGQALWRQADFWWPR